MGKSRFTQKTETLQQIKQDKFNINNYLSMVKVTLRDKKTQYSILGMRKNIHGRYSELVGEGVLLPTGGQRSFLVWLVCS